MHDLEKFLMKRARILEVGYYAAVTIQRFIRGYISRNKTIEYLLLRFEYIHPTKRTEAHYIDRETNDIWDWPPLLIDHCRPASPRTLQRRLDASAKVIVVAVAVIAPLRVEVAPGTVTDDNVI